MKSPSQQLDCGETNGSALGGAVEAEIKAGAGKPVVERNPALDFTKGALVLFMVLYHSVNYFHHDPDVIKYLQFLPPSFIFITGFLVTAIYLAKYDLNDSRMHGRLFVRGLKLLLIFIGLNLVANGLLSRNYNNRPMGLGHLAENATSIFMTGDGRAAVFEVLLPISYLLMLSAVLLKGCRFLPGFLLIFSCLVVGLQLVLDFNGYSTLNLELLSFGFLGMLFGLISFDHINRFAGHFVGLLIANAIYLGVISKAYPTYAVKIIGVTLMLLLLYGFGLKWSRDGLMQKRIMLLGNYSLLAYIIQIGLLQVLVRALRGFESWEVKLGLAFVTASILMTLLIEGVDVLRTKSGLTDRFYKGVFA